MAQKSLKNQKFASEGNRAQTMNRAQTAASQLKRIWKSAPVNKTLFEKPKQISTIDRARIATMDRSYDVAQNTLSCTRKDRE